MARSRAIRPALAALALLAGAGTADAQQTEGGTVVLELFTSQGCSSCPPANALMEKLVEDPRLVALSWHVDYWDYLGWRDSFARPAFTRRQRAYADRTEEIARARGIRGVFTPEMVVEGRESLVGSDSEEVAARIAAHAVRPDAARVEARRGDGRLSVTIRPGPGAGPADVLLLTLRPRAQVEIGKGENAGRRIAYVNIVTGAQQLARWDGTAPMTLKAQGVDGPAAVLVQKEGPGPILGAALVD